MLRKKRKVEEESHERWVVSYADFLTLMFAFFVILYATSEQNTEKGKKFEDSMNKYLVKVGVVGIGGVKPTVNQAQQQNSTIEAPLKKYKKGSGGKNVQGQIETYFEESFNETELEKLIQDISGEDVGVRISFRSQSLFQKNTNDLLPTANKSLEKVGKLLDSLKYRVFIEGHTDYQNNSWSLAANRSVRLADYFNRVIGIEMVEDAIEDARVNAELNGAYRLKILYN